MLVFKLLAQSSDKIEQDKGFYLNITRRAKSILIATLISGQIFSAYAYDCASYQATDPQKYESCTACNNLQDKDWDSSLHECIITDESQELQATSSGIDCYDSSTEEARGQCFTDAASTYFEDEDGVSSDPNLYKDTTLRNGGNTAGMIAQQAMNVATLAISFAGKRNTDKEDCVYISNVLFATASITSILGEFGTALTMAILNHKMKKDYEKALESLDTQFPEPEEGEEEEEEEEEESSTPQTSERDWGGQVYAFQFLEKHEKTKRDVLRVKGGIYAATGALYLAASILGTVDLIKQKTPPQAGGNPNEGNCTDGVGVAKKAKKEGEDKAFIKALPTILTVGVGAVGALVPMMKSGKGSDGGEGGYQDLTNPEIETESSDEEETDAFFNPRNRQDIRNLTLYALSNARNDVEAIMIYDEYYNFINGVKRSPTIDQYEHYLSYFSEQAILDESTPMKSLLAFALKVEQTFWIPSSYAETGVTGKTHGSFGGQPQGSTTTTTTTTTTVTTTTSPPTTSSTGSDGVVVDGTGTSQLETSSDTAGGIDTKKAVVRTVIGYSAAVLNGIMSVSNFKYAAEVEKRRQLIEDMKNNFMRSVATGCKFRDDPSEPQCYCYTDTGGVNAERYQTPTCNSYLSELGFGAASSYENVTGAGTLGCMTNAASYDANCQCKNYKNSAGDTACHSVKNADLSMAFGNADWLSYLANTSNGLTSGTLGAADIDSGQIGQTAKRMKKLSDKLTDKLNKTLASNGQKPMDRDGLIRGMIGAQIRNAKRAIGSNPSSNPLFANASSLLPSDVNKKMADKIKAIDRKATSKLGYSTNKGKGSKKKGSGFSFGNFNMGSSKGKKGKVLTGLMKKNFKYKNADINKNPDTPIWKILTNRYHQSGLPRLFSE
ncbi:MAG: hypothetical protein HOE90_03350 [Bacteriovoracaceae bacterium]|jgi:hypothetical protein|nr:hypothetical protein [Bacteriovoracaceae bacterium]